MEAHVTCANPNTATCVLWVVGPAVRGYYYVNRTIVAGEVVGVNNGRGVISDVVATAVLLSNTRTGSTCPDNIQLLLLLLIHTFSVLSLPCVCVCFLPIHSGHQVRWTYQPGSHRRKVTQDF